MKRTILAGVLIMTSGVSGLLAQKAKSAEETKAVQAVQASVNDPDATIKAAEELMTKYSDTEFKEYALMMEARAYQQKGDEVNAQVYGERVLALNPKNYLMDQLVAEIIAKGIKENDLDKAEKMAKATKLFNDSIESVKGAAKPSPQVSDADWASGQKFTVAEAHNGLGMLAQINKDWPTAIAEYTLAVQDDPDQDAYNTRLASAYLSGGKPAQALEICDKLLAKPNLHPQIKNVVTSIKRAAEAAKK